MDNEYTCTGYYTKMLQSGDPSEKPGIMHPSASNTIYQIMDLKHMKPFSQLPCGGDKISAHQNIQIDKGEIFDTQL